MTAITKISYFLRNIRQKGFFHLLSANILIQLFAFVSQLFVAGILSAEDIGRIKIIQTYLSIFSIIAGMGFNASTLKICSEHKSKQQLSEYFNSAFVFTLISSSLVYGIVLLLNYLEIISKDKLIQVLIPLGMFPLITNSLFLLFIGLFQARKEIKLFSNITVLNKITSIIGIIILSYYWGIKGYYLAYNLSYILMVFVVFFTIKRIVPISFKSFKRIILKEHWHYAKASTLSNIIAETSAYIDIILISFLIKDMIEIGYYSFALTLTIVLRLFPSTVQQITIPYFSSFKSNRAEFLNIFKRYNRLLYIVVFISLLFFMLITPPLVSYIFNGKYDQSFYYLTFLAIGWSIRNLNQLQSAAIFGLGKIHYNAYTALFALLGNMIIYPIAIYYFGLTGAAYASISSGIIIWFASRYYFRKAVKKTTWEA
jgi:O-antigen/teichoic acid export membrane protein